MNNNNIFKCVVFSLGITTILSSSGYAQNIPSSTQPGIIIKSFEEKERPKSTIDEIVTIGDEKADKGVSKEKVFVLNSVVLEGGTVYSPEEINGMVKDYLGQSVSFDDLNAISRIITRKYREDGYMFSTAILPPQKIKDGNVHLQAIEGRITDVKLVGNFKDDNGLIHDMAEKIKSAGPTNTKDLERYLLLIDDLPGIKARSVLQPSATPGGGELLITIEQDDLEGSLGVDNRGSSFVGPVRGTAIASFNSLFGIHDRTTLRGILSSQIEELRFADITHEEQIGTEGTRAKGRFAITDTEPGARLDALDLEGHSTLYDFEVLHPMVRGRQYNLNLLGGFNALNSETDLIGVQISEDRVRSLRGGFQLDFTDTLAGVTELNMQLTKGFDIFGATNDGAGRTRSNGEHEFWRYNIWASRIQDLTSNFSLQLAGSGQYTPDPLLASEEFVLGGSEYGRAFDAGEVTGDRGVAGSIELRYGHPIEDPYIASYQLFTYYDFGKVWNEDPAVGESSQASLASVGIGVRTNFNNGLYASLELDQPLIRDVNSTKDDDVRLFFNVLKRF